MIVGGKNQEHQNFITRRSNAIEASLSHSSNLPPLRLKPLCGIVAILLLSMLPSRILTQCLENKAGWLLLGRVSNVHLSLGLIFNLGRVQARSEFGVFDSIAYSWEEGLDVENHV